MIENYKYKILIVEDDMIIASNIAMQLTNLDYEVIGIETRGNQAIRSVTENRPDILLMDINLKGDLDGIETVGKIKKEFDIPVVYLTANKDDATFLKAKETRPKAFISKPFTELNLKRTLELVVEELKVFDIGKTENTTLEVLQDRIFIRHNGQLEKLLWEQIEYIEADRNYCKIVTSKGDFVLVQTLKTMEEKLPSSLFLRVHRSYLVNISKVDVVTESHLKIMKKLIPLSKTHKALLMERIQTI